MTNTIEFANEVARELEVRTNKFCNVVEVPKNNGTTKIGIVVKDNNDGIQISPTIYVNDYMGLGVELAVERMMEKLEKNFDYREVSMGDFDVEKFGDWNYVKKFLFMELINTERNTEMLKTIPSVPFLDLSIVFRIAVSNDATILITDKHMEEWNITVNELESEARKQSKFVRAANVMKLNDFLGAMGILFKDDLPLYIITNKQNVFGASTILYDDNTVQRLVKELDDDLIIIPSSIHEMLAFPAAQFTNAKEFVYMINEVNTTKVAPEEVLGDRPYIYVRETDSFEFAE